MRDLVSVIMPSYNCRQFVEETIRSVQAQTYQNWELLYYDDCSTDDSIKDVRELQLIDNRIKVFSNSCNCGVAITRNNTLREAKGRWIAFLDSDDVWEPTKLEKQIKFMEKNGYAFSYTGYQEINEKSQPTGIFISGPKRITMQKIRNYCWPGCLTVMYDANKIGLIQISDLKRNNDYAMWLKICKKADCYLLDECLARYRRGRVGSVSSHSITTLIGWHYKLWHEAEEMGVISSLWRTGVNLVFGLYKKLRYVKHVK